MNKSINIKEEILNEFWNKFTVKNNSSKTGVWWIVPKGGASEVASPEEVSDFLSNSLDRMREETYEDVLYRLSFMDAEDTIDDVIKDIEHRKSEEKPKA